jgi:hypothetical protein
MKKTKRRAKQMMKKLTKTFLIGALLIGGTLPTLPAISGDAHAAPTVAAAAKPKKSKTFYGPGYFYVSKGNPASSGQFQLPANTPIYYTFRTNTIKNKKANYIVELVRIGKGPGGGIVGHFKGTATNKEQTQTKLLAKNVKAGKYFIRTYNTTDKSTIRFDCKVHN